MYSYTKHHTSKIVHQKVHFVWNFTFPHKKMLALGWSKGSESTNVGTQSKSKSRPTLVSAVKNSMLVQSSPQTLFVMRIYWKRSRLQQRSSPTSTQWNIFISPPSIILKKINFPEKLLFSTIGATNIQLHVKLYKSMIVTDSLPGNTASTQGSMKSWESKK